MGAVFNLVRLWAVSVIMLAAYYQHMIAAACVAWGGAVCLLSLFAVLCGIAKVKTDGEFQSGPVPKGKTRICVAGYTHCASTAKAHRLVDKIASTHPEAYESWYYFDMYSFRKFVAERLRTAQMAGQMPPPQNPFSRNPQHNAQPFCYLETEEGAFIPIGGVDKLSHWALNLFIEGAGKDQEIIDEAKRPWSYLHYLTGESSHMYLAKGTAQSYRAPITQLVTVVNRTVHPAAVHRVFCGRADVGGRLFVHRGSVSHSASPIRRRRRNVASGESQQTTLIAQ